MMPLVQVILFGYALRSDVRNIRMAIVNPTPDHASLELQSRFLSTDRFRIVASSQTPDAVEPLFRQDKADVALIFDPDFAGHLAGPEPARVLVAIDASDPNTGTTYLAYTRAVIASYQDELAALNRQVRIVTNTRMRFNPTLESVNLFVPGLIALVLVLVSAMMTAVSLSREKERGTMEVLLVSPLHPRQIIVGKVVPYLVIAFANVVTALVAAWAVFHVPFRGSVGLLLLESVLYTLVSLALGVVIAARTSSQRAAMLAALLVTMLPNTLLSGMIFPIASMPRWLTPFTYIVPARWFIVIARGIMLKGVGLTILWRETFILSMMALILLAAAMRSFKARLE
jgi:ABC-2 type transport system permease protein